MTIVVNPVVYDEIKTAYLRTNGYDHVETSAMDENGTYIKKYIDTNNNIVWYEENGPCILTKNIKVNFAPGLTKDVKVEDVFFTSHGKNTDGLDIACYEKY